MDNRNHKIAQKLILIPIVVFAITVICMGFAIILEGPTDRGALYSFFALIGILSIFLSPLPCLVISIVGTVFAAKASKEGNIPSHKYLAIGIVEIIVFVAGVFLACIMFINGQSV